MSGDKDQRTEKPTGKRKKELREKGTHARSPEVAVWLSAIVAVAILPFTIRSATSMLTEMFGQIPEIIKEPDLRKAMGMVKEAFIATALIVLPLGLVLMTVGLLANIVQVGFRPVAKLLTPKLNRINPLSGLKRMVSLTVVWETAKALLKVAFLAFVCWPAITGLLQGITASGGSFEDMVNVGAAAAMQVLRNILIAGVVIAAADYIYQRKKYLGQARMTKQEVKEEYRQQEGDQMVRSTRKARARSMSKNRIIALTANADVVLMNPTHFAVALKYDAEKGAPEVVAKGAGVIALKIREVALEHGVTVVADPPLARALYRVCDIGEFIPGALYEAVARVLAFVFGLKRRGLASGVQSMGAPTTLPEEFAAEDTKMVLRHRIPVAAGASAVGGGPVGAVRLD